MARSRDVARRVVYPSTRRSRFFAHGGRYLLHSSGDCPMNTLRVTENASLDNIMLDFIIRFVKNLVFEPVIQERDIGFVAKVQRQRVGLRLEADNNFRI
jgi:hypothetical protein